MTQTNQEAKTARTHSAWAMTRVTDSQYDCVDSNWEAFQMRAIIGVGVLEPATDKAVQYWTGIAWPGRAETGCERGRRLPKHSPAAPGGTYFCKTRP